MISLHSAMATAPAHSGTLPPTSESSTSRLGATVTSGSPEGAPGRADISRVSPGSGPMSARVIRARAARSESRGADRW